MNKTQSLWKMKWLYTVVLLDIFMWTMLEIESVEVSNWLQNSLLIDAKESSSDILHHRSKRSLFNFQNVILCIQPWAQVLSTYGDYGCYCGYKGAGQPLDDTDKCCYDHDLCYDEADALTKSFSESAMGSYFSDYDYTCKNHLVECDADKNSPYQNALCECDRNAAECFATNRRSYSPKLFDIDTNKYCGNNADYHDLHLNSHSLFKLYSCSLEMNQDRCCVDQGYNSAYALCCDDKIRLKPGMDSTIVACCGSRVFDTRLRMCCYGVLYPNVQHLRCCGNLGQAIDTSFQKCVNGKPEKRKINNNQLDTAKNNTLD